jgi:voltage-gated potassium channel
MGTHPSGLDILRRFRIPLIGVLVAVVYGVLGYSLIFGWNALDALYMTVTTLTTVGFREVHPLGRSGEIFTISLIFIGLSAVFVTIGILTDLLVSGRLGAWLRGRRVDRSVAALQDHFVVCAWGRVGRAATAELREQGIPYVVIDLDRSLGPALEAEGIPHLLADPTRESVLREAGVHRARGMIVAVDSDAVNVYVTLAARAMNPDLVIVARASNPESVATLERAGADRVVSPYDLSGRRMAFLSTRPAVVDFVDMVTVAPDLRLEEIIVRPGSSLDGRTVDEATSSRPGVMIVALKAREGELVASPDPATRLGAGDLVVALGPLGDLEALLA